MSRREAANRIPKDVQSLYTDVPWPQLVSLRDRLIHGYDEIDFDILWQIVTADLPALVAVLEEILPSHKEVQP